MRAPFFAACLLFAADGAAVDLAFTGYARDLDTNALLYVESHSVADAGTAHEMRVVIYRCADGSPFARKELNYAGDRLAPEFRFEDSRSGYAEGLIRGRRTLEAFERSGANAERRAASIAGEGLVADAGFDEFVRARWEALERGETLDAPFLVPSRLDRVPFRVRKVGEAQVGGETATVIRLSLAGVLRFILPDIEVSYRKRDRALVRYRGVTNVRDVAGRSLRAEIEFPEDGRRIGAVDLAALRELPLATRCAQ
jgi:hypothetical protein